ncbi:hypothetical protein HY792_06150, partial [Candidatus Desantisbacteria bacterium]|nr:hypothetical protein [Candidatus Desantisbacteria bacterium]
IFVPEDWVEIRKETLNVPDRSDRMVVIVLCVPKSMVTVALPSKPTP